MNRKYVLFAIILIAIASIGIYAYTSNVEKKAEDARIEAEIDKLVHQTEIDSGEQMSKIREEIKKAQEIEDTETMRALVVLQGDVKAYEIGRTAALHQMPGIVKYNDLEGYLWNIREGFLNRSDFDNAGLKVPEEWQMFANAIEKMNSMKN